MCCSAVAMALNLAYTLWAPELQVPWAVLPIALNAFGIALVFPIVTLAILDMYPHQRGSASSLQAFTSLVLNALVAGLLSPLISSRALWLVAVAMTFLSIAWLFWSWEMRASRPPLESVGEAPSMPGETL
jgi:DHA1 family bicyclomycin/chloramphenicol resistance-like MFS transporter